jgi:hypothetical protein
MSQNDTPDLPNLPNSEPAPPVDLDAELAEQARKIVSWGTGWRYDKSAFPYELKGVMHPVVLEKRIAMKKHFAAAMAEDSPAPPPDMHPALVARGFMDGATAFSDSKFFAFKNIRARPTLRRRSTIP